MTSRTVIRMSSVVMVVALLSPQILLARPFESKRMERAKDLIADEQWARAIDELKAAAADQKEPNKDEALFWLAHSQNQTRDGVAAVETIRRLERDFPASRWVKPARSLRIEIAQRMQRNDVLWYTAAPPPTPAPPATWPVPPTVPLAMHRRHRGRHRCRPRRVLMEFRGLRVTVPPAAVSPTTPVAAPRAPRPPLPPPAWIPKGTSRYRFAHPGARQPHAHGRGESDSDAEGHRARSGKPAKRAAPCSCWRNLAAPKRARRWSKSRRQVRSSSASPLCASSAIWVARRWETTSFRCIRPPTIA